MMKENIGVINTSRPANQSIKNIISKNNISVTAPTILLYVFLERGHIMRKQAACKISMHGDYIIYNNINVGFIIYKTS